MILMREYLCLMLLSLATVSSCKSTGSTAESAGSILDIVSIDTVVVIGHGDMKEQYGNLFNTSRNLTWLPSVTPDGSLIMSGYEPEGRRAVEDTMDIQNLDISDGGGVGLRVKGCAVTPSYYVVKSFNYVAVFERPRAGNRVRLMNAVRLPRSFDNLNAINDSTVILSTWHHRGNMKSTECGAIATLSLKTLTLSLMDMPFTNGLFFTFRRPFSCHTTIRNSVVFIDPTNYDIYLRNVQDTVSHWLKIGKGTIEMIDGLYLRRYYSDSTPTTVSPLLKHALGLDDIAGQRIVYTTCIDNRYLLVCISASTPGEKSDNITYWDIWDFDTETAPKLLYSNLMDTDLSGSRSCSKATFPLLADDFSARPITGGLSMVTILPPFDVTCKTGTPLSDLKGIIDDYLSETPNIPLSLVTYKFHLPASR